MLCGATALQFAFDLLLTNNYGAHGAGIFYLSLSVLMALALLGRLGLDQAAVRFIPHLLKKNPAEASGVRRSAVQLSLALTIPLSIVLFLTAPWLANEVFNSSELTYYLQAFAFAVPPFSLMYIFSGTLRAMKHTRAALSVERAGMYAFAIIAALTVGAFFGLSGLAVGFVVGLYVIATIGALLIKRFMPKHKNVVSFDKKRLMIVAAPLLFVTFATQMNGQVSVLIIGAMSDNASVAIFNIALKISMLMSLILAAINVIASTKISELYSSGRHKQLRIMISKISALGMALGIPLFTVIAIFSNELLGLFGNEFKAGSTALIILIIGQLVNVSVGSTNYILAMTGKEKVLATIVGTSLAINIALGIALVPVLGVVGAAIGTSLTMILGNIATVIVVRKHTKAWPLPFKYIRVWLNGIVRNGE